MRKFTTAISQLLNENKIPEHIEECRIRKFEVENKMSIYKEKWVAEKLKNKLDTQ